MAKSATLSTLPTERELEDELLQSLRMWLPSFPDDHGPDTLLIQPGRLDSLALFNLVMWIEERSGTDVDVTAIDMAREWNSVRDVVRFVVQARKGGETA